MEKLKNNLSGLIKNMLLGMYSAVINTTNVDTKI